MNERKPIRLFEILNSGEIRILQTTFLSTIDVSYTVIRQTYLRFLGLWGEYQRFPQPAHVNHTVTNTVLSIFTIFRFINTRYLPTHYVFQVEVNMNCCIA